MKIPLLTTAFCGCSLQTGTKAVAWIHLVLQALSVVYIVCIVFLGLTIAKQIRSDEGTMKGFNDPDDLWSMKNQQSKKDAAAAIIGAGVIFVVIFSVILLIFFIATIYLLLGAHKQRPGYMKFWLVLSVIGLILSILSFSPGGAASFVINLYLTWVVYSYYRQLSDSPQSSTQPAPREVKLHDGPYVVTQNAPPPYPYNQ